ncbi:MAG: hypothetical protein FJ308_03535 [Planctomycetes bacterium]|nr:hypothetical protein [Planctomycetota bacterium]
MGRIQSNLGLTTGLDIAGTVDKLMAISAQPRDRLQTRIKGLEAQQVAVNELTALVIGAELQNNKLGNAASLATTSVSSSRTDTITATSNGTPIAGTYVTRAVQMAQTSSASSNVFSSTSDTLQAGEIVVRTGGFVDRSANLEDLRGGAGVTRGKIKITDRNGTGTTIDLRFASTMEDVVKSINTAMDVRVSAKVSGDRIVLTDLTGKSSSNLIVEEVGDGRTASDLGLGAVNVASASGTGDDIAYASGTTRLSSLRDGIGIAFRSGTDFTVSLADGTSLSVDANASGSPTTVNQLLTALNAASPSKLLARIDSSGNGIELVDKTTGSGTFSATGSLAEQLGLSGTVAVSGTISGARVASAISGPLLSSLNGGDGIGTPGSITITNRAGATTTVNLVGSNSLRDVIDQINASGAGVTASLNRARTGITLQDVTGSATSNLIVANGDAKSTATKLNIAGSVASNSIDSGALNLQFVGETTALSKLNQGRGVGLGTFNITNASGVTRSINLTASSEQTVGAVINAINATGIGIEASINDAGDGITIKDTSGGSGQFSISDKSGSTTAKDLGIAGTGTSKVVGGATIQQIDASQNFRITLESNQKLSDVVEKLNQASGNPITASLLTAGSSIRMLFSSKASGEAGRMVIDGSAVGLDVSSTSTGRDAILAVSPTDDLGGTFVRSSTNTFSGAIQGLSLTIASVQTESVQIRVNSDNSGFEKNVQLFVDQFNKIKDKLSTIASYDATTKTSGILYASNEAYRTEQGLARIINQRIAFTGPVQTPSQIGLSLDETGKLRFDKSKLSAALDANPDAVKEFFTKANTGFSARTKSIIDGLSGASNGVLVNRTSTLQRQIDDNNKRIESINVKLTREREKLLNQFYKMEETIGKLKNSSSAISQLQPINLYSNSSSSSN